MKTSTNQTRSGMQWTPLTKLEDIDFADDIVILSHLYKQMQDKINIITEV